MIPAKADADKKEEFLEKKLAPVLDQARDGKCKLVGEQAERLKIELLYLPPYSPNLNIIERL